MTPHETGSTATPGAPRSDGAARAHVRPPGADPGRSQRRLPPGLPGPAVPVPEHRSRPDRPSRRLLRSRRAGRRAHHLSDPPVPTRPARRRGGHRHHQSRDLGPPSAWAPSPSTGAGSTPCPASPTACARILPARGFFEHPEYLAVRVHLPAPWQDILDLAYYSGWRKNEILGLTWDELDEAGGVIRLSPARSKTLVGRILPISQPIAEALARRRARRDPTSPLVFHRDGIPVRRWRTAWRTACQAAGVPTRFLHDCRRTAARNLIRASVPERVAMLLTGHKTRAIFDRYNIINEQELLEAGDQLVAYLAQHAQATPRGGRPYPAGAGHRPSGRRRSRPDHSYEPARDRGTRGDGAGRRGQPRARAQGLDNQLLQRPPPPGRSDADMQRCERLGGLLGFYESGRPINRTLRPRATLGHTSLPPRSRPAARTTAVRSLSTSQPCLYCQ